MEKWKNGFWENGVLLYWPATAGFSEDNRKMLPLKNQPSSIALKLHFVPTIPLFLDLEKPPDPKYSLVYRQVV
jgi:hypothetical protein